MSDRVWRLMDLINTSTQYLDGKGIESPRRNAEALMSKVLNLPRIDLYLQHDRPLTEPEISAYREVIRRRSRHEPLQLLLGTVEFCDVTLEIVPGLLIPRPETELLVELVTTSLRATGKVESARILDIGTGTGCIAVALAAQNPLVRVDALDINFEAVKCAERNAVLNGVKTRVRGVLGDVFHPDFLQTISPPYDVVVSNPPYVTEDEYAHLADEVRLHESKKALVAAENGLAFYRQFARLLPSLLQPGGIAAFEIGQGQADAVRSLLDSALNSLEIRKDYNGISRMVCGRLRA
jgi:release factor glutamine methyltransferase